MPLRSIGHLHPKGVQNDTVTKLQLRQLIRTPPNGLWEPFRFREPNGPGSSQDQASPGTCPGPSLRDITPAAAPDADTAVLLDRGCATQQASLTALQSAGAGSPRDSYTRSASPFDRAERRLTGAGGKAAKGHLAFRDLRLIDGALAELAGALGMGITGCICSSI